MASVEYQSAFTWANERLCVCVLAQSWSGHVRLQIAVVHKMTRELIVASLFNWEPQTCCKGLVFWGMLVDRQSTLAESQYS